MKSETAMSTLGAIDVLILAGGLGTRLQSVIADRPKILAPVAGEPFLDRLLSKLSKEGARRIVLALGYLADAVLDHLRGHNFPNLEVVPVIEPQPLGTAGALALASKQFKSDPVMVMNGDTWIEADLRSFLSDYERGADMISMLCVHVTNPGRYGRVELDGAGRVVSFREKDGTDLTASWINGGVYLFDRPTLGRIAGDFQSGSLEHNVLGRLPAGSIHAYCSEGRFLDIGTPEDLAAAEVFFGENR